jgi:hypothetical protein
VTRAPRMTFPLSWRGVAALLSCLTIAASAAAQQASAPSRPKPAQPSAAGPPWVKQAPPVATSSLPQQPSPTPSAPPPAQSTPPGATSAQTSAEAQLALGAVYGRSGRWADAQAAYAKAAADGSQQTRREALIALDRMILARESAGAWQQLRLGQMYEELGRWADAQAAYKSVLETGPPGMQAIAQERLRSIAENQEGMWERYAQPVLTAGGVAVVTVLGAILLYFVLGPPLGWLGRRRGRHRLVIGSFVPPTSESRIGSNFTEVVAAMHERMEAHFRPRIGIGDPKLPALVNSQSAELVEWIGTLNAPALPLLNWFAQKLNKPAYRISGFVASARTDVRVFAKLEHRGNSVGRWNKTVRIRDWFQCEQDLAYEILLTLKEYVDEHAS